MTVFAIPFLAEITTLCTGWCFIPRRWCGSGTSWYCTFTSIGFTFAVAYTAANFLISSRVVTNESLWLLWAVARIGVYSYGVLPVTFTEKFLVTIHDMNAFFTFCISEVLACLKYLRLIELTNLTVMVKLAAPYVRLMSFVATYWEIFPSCRASAESSSRSHSRPLMGIRRSITWCPRSLRSTFFFLNTVLSSSVTVGS